MPRQSGQIDALKSEHILDAAAEVFSERGLDAPVEEIARRANVSKQTVYNHFGSKEDLLRALFDRRRKLLMEPLGQSHSDEPLEERLTAYLVRIIEAYLTPGYRGVMRSAIAATPMRPEIGAMVYESGPKQGRTQLAAFLTREAAAGRIEVDDPEQAAEFLVGMVAGGLMQRVLLDAPVDRSPEHIARKARACAQRFLRAYAPS
jgi:TetR/AcrR family transcriptional regulator, mexJK operon transcriptional repressor